MKHGRLDRRRADRTARLSARLVGLTIAASVVAPTVEACWPYVSGNVVVDGQPAEGVQVDIHNTGDGFLCGPQDFVDTTDADGEFSTCVQCAGTVTVTIQDESRILFVNGNTDFGEWEIDGVPGDNDRDGIDDGYEDYLLEKFAPKIWLHSNENRWPVNVDWMLPRTHMRYHHRTCSDDEIISHGSVTNANMTEQCHQDKRIIGDGWPWEWCSHSGGCNASDQHKAGWKGGFFLQYYDSSHYGSTNPQDWVLYGHVYPGAYDRTVVQYWQAYSYNDSLGSANHEGDWEYTAVVLDSNEQPVWVIYYMHGRAQYYAPSEVDWEGDHHVTYSAKGSHAQYKGFAGWPIRCDTEGILDEIQFYADHCDQGTAWNSWDTAATGGIVNVGERGFPLNDSNWLRYSGRWGEYGFASIFTIQFTSGPHGPGYQDSHWHISGATEVCGNGVDDDVDGVIDESQCNAAPDLSMSDTEPALATDGAPGSVSVAPGASFQVRCGLDNLGGQIHATFRIDFYLSKDTVFDPDDTQLSGCLDLFGMPQTTSYPPLPTWEVTVPAGTPEDVYHVIAVADGGGVVAEEDETNNTLVSDNLVRVVEPVGKGDTLLLTNFDSRSAPEFTPVAGSWDAGIESYSATVTGAPSDDTVSLHTLTESDTRTSVDVTVRDWDGAHDLAWGVVQRYVDAQQFLRVEAVRNGDTTEFRLIQMDGVSQVLASGIYVGDPLGQASGSGKIDKGIIQVAVEDTGSRLCLYVNDQEVFQAAYSSSVPTGTHGLFVNAGHTVDFDNVVVTRLVDADGDGWSRCAGDCDDTNAQVYPGRSEVCATTYDDDCDGIANEGCGGGGGCFAGGTRVLMADGLPKPIELVQVGDRVRSYDVGADAPVIGRVVEVFHHATAEELLVINGSLRVTPNHEFYVDGHWRPARELQPGDGMSRYTPGLGTGLARLTPQTVRTVERVRSRVAVYNLEVEGVHNYFADGVLVHNRKLPTQIVEDPIP